jgi:hypothetical protein
MWATVQNSLGLLWLQFGAQDEPALASAMEAFERAQQVWTKDLHRREWADAALNCAAVWIQRSLAAESDTRTSSRTAVQTSLAAAVTLCTDALSVLTIDVDRFLWARAHGILGQAHRGISLHPHTNLQRARHCYELALGVFTADLYPEEHATMTAHLERTDRMLAELRQNRQPPES